MRTIVVVGAGVSGLAAAHFLRQGLKAGGLDARILVLESDTVPGGKMRTVVQDGFRLEWGPNGFLTNKPHTLELVKELGLEGRLLRSRDSARRRYLLSRGRLVRLPETPWAFLSSGLLSLPGFLRILAEPFAEPPGEEDESVSEFAARRLGAEALEKLIEPMAAGVFAGDPDRLSLDSCFPRIRELERRYGGLIKAMLELKRERAGSGVRSEMSAGPGGVLTSFDSGVGALIEVLAGRQGGDLRLGCAAERVGRRGARWSVGFREGGAAAEVEADALMLACPAYAAARLLGPVDEALAGELARIPYVPVSVAALGYDAARLGRSLDGFGFLVPRTEGRRILGALWDSSVFDGRAPEGRALIRVMIGGARQPRLACLPAGEALSLAKSELAFAMGIGAEPVLERVFFHERAIPQYPVGHAAALGRIAARLAVLPGLFLNSNAYRGIGLNDCVRESRIAAENAAAFVRGMP